MQVILTEDVNHVGDMGDIVKVSNGFGRNYLVPQGLALPVTGQKAKQFEHQRRLIERRKAQLRQAALGLVGKLNGISVTIPRQVGESDKLYGSVTKRDIQTAINNEGFEVDRRKLMLNAPLRELGIYEIEIKLHSDVRAKIRVWVTAM